MKAKDFRKKAWSACKGNWGNLILVLVINFALIVVCGLIGIILFGMGISKDKPAEFKDEPITIRIKADCKKDILKELQMLEIDEATLFPETDKIMKQIKSQYIKN